MDLDHLIEYLLAQGHCDILLVGITGLLLWLHKQNRERIAELLKEIRSHGWPNG